MDGEDMGGQLLAQGKRGRQEEEDLWVREVKKLQLSNSNDSEVVSSDVSRGVSPQPTEDPEVVEYLRENERLRILHLQRLQRFRGPQT